MVAALGLSGCSSNDPPTPIPSPRATAGTTGLLPPQAAPLPAPDVLTAVLYRLVDTSIPADQKLALVQYATADDAAVLGNFGQALTDGGFRALTIQATDLAWSSQPGSVTAVVTIASADPAKTFIYPMEFTPIRDTWQLTRRTADQLLQLSASAIPTPTR